MNTWELLGYATLVFCIIIVFIWVIFDEFLDNK